MSTGDEVRAPMRPDNGDWLRALGLAEAAADRDHDRMSDVIADAMVAGDTPRLMQLLYVYAAITPPIDKALIALVHQRIVDDEFDGIT